MTFTRLIRAAASAAALSFFFFSTALAQTLGERFELAQRLLQAGRAAEAAYILRDLHAEYPDLPRIQLDYALALYRLGMDKEARALFLDVRRRPDLPPQVMRNVEEFLQRLRARESLQLSFDFGVWYDSNVNNASEVDTVEIPVFGTTLPFTLEEQAVGAPVVRIGAGARWRYPIARTVHIETRGSVARNTAVGKPQYNRAWASLSSGPRYSYGTGVLKADIGFERRWRDSDDYSLSRWIGLGVDQALSADWRAGLGVRLWLTDYHGRASEYDPVGRGLNLELGRRLGPGWLTLGAGFSRERPDVRHQRWRSRSAALDYRATFGRDWNVAGRASISGTDFDDASSLFGIRRSDRAHGFTLRLSHRALAWEGYLPELIFDISRSFSNIPVYSRDVRTARIGVVRLF